LQIELEQFCKLFADDTKLIAPIKNITDCIKLQSDLNKATDWATTWKMKFNNEKCKVMHIGKKNQAFEYSMSVNSIERKILGVTEAERDLGIIITKDLKWGCQTQKAANKANAVLGILKRTFSYWTPDTLKILYVTFVRPHLEYASSVWSPYQKQDITTLENVQRRATKLIPSLKSISYEKRLEIIGLTILQDRRARGDSIQFFKFKNNFNSIDWYHPNALTTSINSKGPASGIRGHNQRFHRQPTRNCQARENFFSNRTIPTWNALPKAVVESCSINGFKASYDEFKSKRNKTKSTNNRAK
jgi:hypothetical protein